MKRYFTSCPESIDEGRLFGFKSWQEHVAGVSSPLAAVTGYKSNGSSNLTMQSWCAVHGDRVVFASVERGSHMYGVLRERGEVVVNFPGAESFNRCMRSIEHNGWDEDEIYFVYNEMREVFPAMGFEKFSYCAGVLALEKEK